jgi:hypothetical protein
MATAAILKKINPIQHNFTWHMNNGMGWRPLLLCNGNSSYYSYYYYSSTHFCSLYFSEMPWSKLPWQRPPFWICTTSNSCHTLQWIFLQSFMKFDERNPKLF